MSELVSKNLAIAVKNTSRPALKIDPKTPTPTAAIVIEEVSDSCCSFPGFCNGGSSGVTAQKPCFQGQVPKCAERCTLSLFLQNSFKMTVYVPQILTWYLHRNINTCVTYVAHHIAFVTLWMRVFLVRKFLLRFNQKTDPKVCVPRGLLEGHFDEIFDRN